MAHWCDHLLEQIPEDERYEDWRSGSARYEQGNPGEISPAAITALHAMVLDKMQDRDAFAHWFGQYNSGRKYPDTDWEPEVPLLPKDVTNYIREQAPLLRNPASRFSFIRKGEGSLTLFIDGASFDCDGETSVFAERICGLDRIVMDADWGHIVSIVELLVQLLNQGSVAFEEQDEW